MCQTRPGPRCASHTRAALHKAERDLAVATDVRDQAVAQRATTTGRTPDQVLAVPSAAIRRVVSDYHQAVAAHAEAQLAHDATRTGQTHLQASIKQAQEAGHYVHAQRLTQRLTEARARHQHDQTLAHIASDQRNRLTDALHPLHWAAHDLTTAELATTKARDHLRALVDRDHIDPPAQADAHSVIDGTWASADTHEALIAFQEAARHQHIVKALVGANVNSRYAPETLQAGTPNSVEHHTDGTTNAYLYHAPQEGLPDGYVAPLSHVPDPDLPLGHRYVDTITGTTVYPAPGDTYGDIPTYVITAPTITSPAATATPTLTTSPAYAAS